MNTLAACGVVARAVPRDLTRMARWGRTAPRFAERIWIDPRRCEHAVRGISRRRSGEVADGDWDLDVTAWEDTSRVARHCRLRWQDGLSWEEAGAYDYLMGLIERSGRPRDGCSTLDDVVARYERLDAMFEDARARGRLAAKNELPGLSFREFGGVIVHVDRGGSPLFGRKGNHRFAIARILGHDRMPAQVGVVHVGALPGWRVRIAEGVGNA